MTPTAILERLQRAGLRVSERAGVLHAGPAALLTDGLREQIAANRAILLSEIERRRPAFVLELVELFPGSSVDHAVGGEHEAR